MFMKILMRGTNGCDELASKESYFYDICFSVVKTDKEGIDEEVDYCRPVKIIHKGFLLAMF